MCHLSSSLFLHYLYAFHWVMFGTSAVNAAYNSMPFDGMNGEALSILQVLTGEVLLSLCLLILPCVGSETRG